MVRMRLPKTPLPVSRSGSPKSIGLRDHFSAEHFQRGVTCVVPLVTTALPVAVEPVPGKRHSSGPFWESASMLACVAIEHSHVLTTSGGIMKQKVLRTIALTSFVFVVMLAAGWPAQAQDVKTPYPNMVQLDQYMMERDAEIALARSAAPDSISMDAEVMVLGQHGYETAVKGKNGFVCLVERSWDAAV